jgi:hypothetical protein
MNKTARAHLTGDWADSACTELGNISCVLEVASWAAVIAEVASLNKIMTLMLKLDEYRRTCVLELCLRLRPGQDIRSWSEPQWFFGSSLGVALHNTLDTVGHLSRLNTYVAGPPL